MSDYENVLRIAKLSDQILAAIQNMEPALTKNYLAGRDTWYDLRGCVEEPIRLAVIFTTKVGTHAGMQVPPANTGLTHIVMMPQLWRPRWNLRLLQTQSLLQHELAHVLLHDVREDDVASDIASAAYFNDPKEIEAYMHQAMARMAKAAHEDQFSWTSGPVTPEKLLGADEAQFAAKVIGNFPPKALRHLTIENKAGLVERLRLLHREALLTFESERSPALA